MHRRTTALATLAVALLAAPAADADGTTHRWSDSTPVVAPVDELHGDDAGELLGEWVDQQLRLSLDANPLNGNTDLCLQLGDEREVVSPANGTGASACTVERATDVFLVTAFAECSSAEASPFFGATADEQRSCVVDFWANTPLDAIRVTVDGGRPVDVHSDDFFVVSPQVHTVFPDPAIFDAKPGPATVVAASWVARAPWLRVGSHRIDFEVLVGGQVAASWVVTLNVVRDEDDDDD